MENQTKIYDLEIDYETDYREIKHPRLEFKTGRLFLVLPKNYKEEHNLIEKHKEWIQCKKEIDIQYFIEIFTGKSYKIYCFP